MSAATTRACTTPPMVGPGGGEGRAPDEERRRGGDGGMLAARERQGRWGGIPAGASHDRRRRHRWLDQRLLVPSELGAERREGHTVSARGRHGLVHSGEDLRRQVWNSLPGAAQRMLEASFRGHRPEFGRALGVKELHGGGFDVPRDVGRVCHKGAPVRRRR